MALQDPGRISRALGLQVLALQGPTLQLPVVDKKNGQIKVSVGTTA